MMILICITLVHAYFKLNRKNEKDILCIFFKLTILIILFLEVLSVLYDKNSLITNIMIHRLINVAGFSLAPVPIFIIWILLNKWVNKERNNKRMLVLISMPLILNIIFSILSYKFNYIFQVSQHDVYSRGIVFIIAPIVSVFYYIINLIFIWENRKKLSKEEIIVFGVIVLLPLLLGSVQLKYKVCLTIWSSAAISSIILYIFILNDKLRWDGLTQVGNRNDYIQYVEKLKKKKNLKLIVINIDLDGVKYINDNYGHNEGDETIRVFASLLTEVFGRLIRTIRLGGDEFVIFIEDDNEFIVENCIKNLKRKLNIYNENNSKKYNIQFSYAMGIYNEKEETIEELLERCDKKMYYHKNKKNTIKSIIKV